MAGIETMAMASKWTMSAVLKYPLVAKKIQDEIESVVCRERTVSESDIGSMEYVHCVIKEALRFVGIFVSVLPLDPNVHLPPDRLQQLETINTGR